MTIAKNDEKSPQKGKVFTLGNTATSIGSNRPQGRRRSKLMLSFLLCVLLPFLAATFYYAIIATDRYAARAGFSIRGTDTSTGIDGIGALTGLASTGSTTSDSYILLSYLTSRELVEAVDKQFNLRSAYSSPKVDLLSRLAPDATVEDLLRYWKRRIHTQFDPRSGIIKFEVQAFTPERARKIADLVLTLAQALVNELSANARNDTLRFARQEVALQESRRREALGAIRNFRASEQSIDPSASAALGIEQIANLKAQLTDVNAQIAALHQTLDENAPSLTALRHKADALAAQIVEHRQAIGNDGALTRQLARYEELEVERTFAQQAYASALASLEQARRDADRQQRYLAIYLHPQVAEAAQYPHRLRDLLVMGFALIAAWGIGALITYSVRDHLT